MFKGVKSKVDFPLLERETLKRWEKQKLLEKYINKNQAAKERFSFIDGPITANNPMGVHHAWGRTYKDLWQRFFNMKGYSERFQNGFDEQGLWVEVEVEKELGLQSKKDIENLVKGNVSESIAKFVNLCKERVKKFSSVQTEQSKRLGYFMDWDNSYHTSSDQNNYAIWHYLKEIDSKDWLYKGRDSVPWCPRCGTAISQHEILTEEYKLVEHPSVFFKLPLKNRKNEYLLVWTTTPWTIPGNVAIALNPNLEYAKAEATNSEIYYLASSRLGVLGKGVVTSKTVKTSDLIGLEYEGPFDNLDHIKNSLGKYKHRVVASDDQVLPITSEEGTGLVHIAPGAGAEDFQLAKKENLPVIALIDEEANYIQGLGEFSGKNAKKHPELISDYLEKKEKGKFFFSTENYKHRYPTCWRCKTELVWRVVDEWYIHMDRPDPETGKNYRDLLKEIIKPDKINWLPSWGYNRELDWLNNMHDWLISKKRYWGLALPIWECKDCNFFKVVGSKEELKNLASSGWGSFDGHSPHRPWIDQVKIKCEKCGQEISRISDVGNPWLDAGIVPFSTLGYFEKRSYWEDWFPADFITESFPGQFKNWFYSLLAMSAVLEGRTPFKTLLGYGSVRDEKGEEMHKSKGNTIWFDEAAEKIGVDVMRWIYATANPELNVNFGYHVGDEVRRRFFLILWNVYSFFVTYARIDKWEPSQETESKNILDRWLISELNRLVSEVNENLTIYDAKTSAKALEDFTVNKLSTWYVRRIRDRLGPNREKGDDKDACYQTLYTTLLTLTKLLAPFTPFIADEIFTNLTEDESVHLESFPIPDTGAIDKKLNKNMELLRTIVEAGHAARKEKNVKVRQPLPRAEVFLPKNKGFEDLVRSEELQVVIKDELNLKNIDLMIGDKPEVIVELDTLVDENLKQEGEAREIIRQIQGARKEAGCSMEDYVEVVLPNWPEKFTEFIKKETLAKKLFKGKKIKIRK